MNDRPKILAGTAVFVVVVTLPLWFTNAAGNPDHKPQVELPPSGQCVLGRQEMRARHMELLNEWRNEVVRHGKRVYLAPDGAEYTMSLSNTCLSCHESKERFCDRCHEYAGVDPDCWDCHVTPTAE